MNSNLKTALVTFQLTNLDLAKATGIDPSLISRYISGNRKLRQKSKQAEDIAEFLLNKADSVERIDWLKEQFEQFGISEGMHSVMAMKENLILWISSDGELPSDNAGESFEMEETVEETRPDGCENDLKYGIHEITDAMTEEFREVPSGESVDIFLTSDRFGTFTDSLFAGMLHEVLARREITMNIVIGISGDTRQLGRITQTYMGEMVSGTMRFYTFFGATRNVAEQMFCIFPNDTAMIVTETPVGAAHPIGALVRRQEFVRELGQSFDATYRYSQSMFNIYSDDYLRPMIEVLYSEYCIPGALSVVKDSINPMYMSFEAYCRVLRKDNKDDAEYAWKCNEYRRFNDSFEATLQNGMPCREIISLKRLKTIVQERKCKMAGVYFLTTAFFELDLEGCRDILTGYIEYLNRYSNFSLLILDELPELHTSNCWHVKENQSVAFNDWNGNVPIMCQSSHAALVREFQEHFESIWKRGTGSLSNRAYVISILKSIIREIERVLN